MRAITSTSFNILTVGAGFADCTTNTAEPDTFVGDMKRKLHVSPANASEKAEAQLAVFLFVRIAAELFRATKVKIFL